MPPLVAKRCRLHTAIARSRSPAGSSRHHHSPNYVPPQAPLPQRPAHTILVAAERAWLLIRCARHYAPAGVSHSLRYDKICGQIEEWKGGVPTTTLPLAVLGAEAWRIPRGREWTGGLAGRHPAASVRRGQTSACPRGDATCGASRRGRRRIWHFATCHYHGGVGADMEDACYQRTPTRTAPPRAPLRLGGPPSVAHRRCSPTRNTVPLLPLLCGATARIHRCHTAPFSFYHCSGPPATGASSSLAVLPLLFTPRATSA